MSATGGNYKDTSVKETRIEIAIVADHGDDGTVTLDRGHSMLTAVRDARRAPPPPLADDDPRHAIFDREVEKLLTAQQDSNYTKERLLMKRNQLLDRLDTAKDVEPLFDKMIDAVLASRTAKACIKTRFHIRLLAAVLSVYRPDIYRSGALEIGRHFYDRAERRLVVEGAFTDQELQRAL